jgi:hypothetical protein
MMSGTSSPHIELHILHRFRGKDRGHFDRRHNIELDQRHDITLLDGFHLGRDCVSCNMLHGILFFFDDPFIFSHQAIRLPFHPSPGFLTDQ